MRRLIGFAVVLVLLVLAQLPGPVGGAGAPTPDYKATIAAGVEATLTAMAPTPTLDVAAAIEATVAAITGGQLAPTATPVFSPTVSSEGHIVALYFRKSPEETVKVTPKEPDAGVAYREGDFVYGEVAIRFEETFLFDHEPEGGEPTSLPEGWTVEFQFSGNLIRWVEGPVGYNANRAQFWVGRLPLGCAIGWEEESPLADETRYAIGVSLLKNGRLMEGPAWFYFAVQASPQPGGGGPTPHPTPPEDKPEPEPA